MLLINKLTAPGTIKRIELHPDTVRITMQDGTERVYRDNEPYYRTLSDPGHLDAMNNMERE